jgi:hypothetical protein
MKTDASSTKRKPGVELTNAISSIHRWTKIQFNNIKSQEKLPVCWSAGNNRLIIGNYYVEKITDRAWRVKDHNREFVHDFVSKPSAVFYSLCMQVNQIPLSHKLLKHDNQLGLLEADFSFLKIRYKKAQEKKDLFYLQLYAAKLTQNLAQQKAARLLLEKTLRSAKYLKLWENMP